MHPPLLRLPERNSRFINVVLPHPLDDHRDLLAAGIDRLKSRSTSRDSGNTEAHAPELDRQTVRRGAAGLGLTSGSGRSTSLENALARGLALIELLQTDMPCTASKLSNCHEDEHREVYATNLARFYERCNQPQHSKRCERREQNQTAGVQCPCRRQSSRRTRNRRPWLLAGCDDDQLESNTIRSGGSAYLIDQCGLQLSTRFHQLP